MRRLYLVLLLGLALVGTALGADVTTLNGVIQTWHNGTATLANNATVTSGAITLTNVGYPKATCECFIPAPSGTAIANSNIAVWFKRTLDGTNFEDAPGARLADFTCPLQAVSTAQRVIIDNISLPAQNGFQIVVKNNGTGVTFNATWTIKCTPYTQRLQ